MTMVRQQISSVAAEPLEDHSYLGGARPPRSLVNVLLGLLISVAAMGLTGCAGSGGAYKLPAGVTVGDISGPGQDQLSRALKKRGGGGSAKMILSGQVSLSRQETGERETVPREVAAGPPQAAYQPDPFTGRVWLVEETPMATELDSYDFKRLTGDLIFDWRLTSKTGGQVDSGRVVLNIDRTRGGYLAAQGLAPPLSGSKTKGDDLESRLAGELVRLLTLDLGRYPSASELETGDDSLSRKAKSLASAGNWQEAQALWLELLDQNPRYSPALYNLGLYWERRQDPEEAWRYYRAAFLSDGSDSHRAALTRLTETLSRAGRLPKRGSAPTKGNL